MSYCPRIQREDSNQLSEVDRAETTQPINEVEEKVVNDNKPEYEAKEERSERRKHEYSKGETNFIACAPFMNV